MELKNILKQLQEGYKEACWETKAMSRKRGLQDEEKSLVDTKNYAEIFFLSESVMWNL